MNLEYLLKATPPILSLFSVGVHFDVVSIVAARGPPDFGWDPIFQPQGFSLTYAEMESEVKNSISHRYKALCALRDYLTGQTEEGERGEERGGGKGEIIRQRDPNLIDSMYHTMLTVQ